jgi:23S rRNA pseudouridine2604 synthase
MMGAAMRINKYISETGFCSRRATNRLIEEKRITVNGAVCEPGTMISSGDVVLIDGLVIPEKAEAVYIALHKPVGITCTAARTVDGNIIDFMNYPGRIFPIGRLDKDSQGLILMTNDGEIVNKMMRSEFGHEKEYVVTVNHLITDDFIKRMSGGIEILGTTTKPCKVSRISDYEFRIILTQGLNRQIRRMAKECGYRVTRLERIRIMNVTMDDLEMGKWRELSKIELANMLDQLADTVQL